MKISVVIPCFNQGLYLCHAVKSIFQQTYSNWECIIVNDGSNDDSLNIALEFERKDSRFKVINQQNSGVSVARNNGIIKSTGVLIQFLDADDLLQPNKFEWTISIFQRKPSCDIVVTDARYFLEDHNTNLQFGLKKTDTEWIAPIWNQKRDIIDKLLENNITPINSPIIKKDVILKAGLFDEKLRTMEDWNLWAKCAFMSSSFYFESVPNTFALIRVHQASVSNNSILMYKGHFDHTVNIGRYITKNNHKVKNFRLGMMRLEKYQKNYGFKNLVKLFWANKCLENAINIIFLYIKLIQKK